MHDDELLRAVAETMKSSEIQLDPRLERLVHGQLTDDELRKLNDDAARDERLALAMNMLQPPSEAFEERVVDAAAHAAKPAGQVLRLRTWAPWAAALAASVALLWMGQSGSGTSVGQSGSGTSVGQSRSGTSVGQSTNEMAALPSYQLEFDSRPTMRGEVPRATSEGQSGSGTSVGQSGSGTSVGQSRSGTSVGQSGSGTSVGQSGSGTSVDAATPLSLTMRAERAVTTAVEAAAYAVQGDRWVALSSSQLTVKRGSVRWQGALEGHDLRPGAVRVVFVVAQPGLLPSVAELRASKSPTDAWRSESLELQLQGRRGGAPRP